jgi:hypothetical protein
MRCDEFEVRLNEVLDQRREPGSDVGLAQHMRQCGECRSLANSYQAVLQGLRCSMPLPVVGDLALSDVPDLTRDPSARGRDPGDPTGNLADRVLAALDPARSVLRLPSHGARRHTGSWRQRTGKRWTVLAAAAAVLLFVIGPWAWFGRGNRHIAPRRSEAGPLVEAGPLAEAGPIAQPRPGRAGPGVNGRHLGARSGETAVGYRRLARETRASLSMAMQLVPGIGDTKAPPREAAMPTLPTAEWVQELTDGLTPVTRPTAGVMSTFIELLSAPDEDTHS